MKQRRGLRFGRIDPLIREQELCARLFERSALVGAFYDARFGLWEYIPPSCCCGFARGVAEWLGFMDLEVVRNGAAWRR